MKLPLRIRVRRLVWRTLVVLVVLAGIGTAPVSVVSSAQDFPADAFDGSWRLETGEVVTGGHFGEGGRNLFLFMDTDGLARGSLFERVGPLRFRSLFPTTTTELEFTHAAGAAPGGLIWRDRGRAAVAGARVYPHQSKPLRFASADGTELDGRLLLPDCPGPHPLVVSVHGSGPIDRHGGPYHTFFLRYGVAVLAYDKRGYTADTSLWREPDLETLAADATAALRMGAGLEGIDRDRVGYMGSSQAGWVVPRAAVMAPETDFLLVRAGAALSVQATVLHEIRQEFRIEGLSGLDLDDAVALRRELYMAAAAGLPVTEADRIASPYRDRSWYPTAVGAGLPSERWSERAWSWQQRNMSVSPLAWLARFEGPVLWFLAGQDENVPLVPTRAALDRVFLASGRDQQVVVLDGALHSFLIPGADGVPRFSPGFFDRMVSWMAERGISRPECWN